MISTEQALYVTMQEHGYSHGLIVTAMRVMNGSVPRIQDLMLYIEDENPSEEEVIARLAE